MTGNGPRARWVPTLPRSTHRHAKHAALWHDLQGRLERTAQGWLEYPCETLRAAANLSNSMLARAEARHGKGWLVGRVRVNEDGEPCAYFARGKAYR